MLPTLYSIYTRDCPVSDAAINVLYEDDISQVVYQRGRFSRKIASINTFKKEWRLRTNLAKFNMIPLATKIPALLTVEGDDIDFSPRDSIQRFSVFSMGYTVHVSQRVARAKSVFTRLYHFRDVATGLKL